MMTAAAIDRLVHHHCVVLELNIPSYRVAQAKKAKGELADVTFSEPCGNAGPFNAWKPNAGFPPFRLPLEIAAAIPTFPQPRAFGF
jgi:hypothetical protein